MYTRICNDQGLNAYPGGYKCDVSESWGDYVRRVTASRTQKDVGTATGLDPTAISRWLRNQNVPRAEKAVLFARALGESPLEALIAAGYLTPEEAGATTKVRTALREFSFDEIVSELRRRTVEGD